MDGVTNLPGEPSERPETAEARGLWLAREAAMIVEAEAELAAGQGIPQAGANAWLDSLGRIDRCRSPRGLDAHPHLRASAPQ